MRIKFLALAIVIAAEGFGVNASYAQNTVGEITIYPENPNRQLPYDFVGFSYEYGMFQANRTPLDKLPNLIKLTSSLGDNVSIRVGGGTVDRQNSAMPQNALLGLAHFVKMVSKNSPLIEGLNYLGHHPAWGISDATALSSVLGTQVVYQLGNEPDLYPGISEQKFASDWMRMRNDIIKSIPSARFYGPDTAHFDNYASSFVSTLVNKLTTITVHSYGQGSEQDSPNDVRSALASKKTLVLVSKVQSIKSSIKTNLPIRLTESGDISGKNTVTANSLGGAIWCLREMVILAENGWAGVNFHGDAYTTTPGGYSPFFADGKGNYTPQATFYAMWLFSRFQGMKIIPAETFNVPSYVSIFAARGDDQNIHLLLVNADERNTFQLRVSGINKSANTSVITMWAPSLDSTDVTIGGNKISTDLSVPFTPKANTAKIDLKTDMISVKPHTAEIVTLSLVP